MTAKRIYVLNGHPAESSLNRTLAESYAQAARDAGHDVRLTHLHDLQFDPDYEYGGYKNQKPLEQGLEQVLENIEWSQHMVSDHAYVVGRFAGQIERPVRSHPSARADIRHTKHNLDGFTGSHVDGADRPDDRDFRHARPDVALVLPQRHVAPAARPDFRLCRHQACQNHLLFRRQPSQNRCR